MPTPTQDWMVAKFGAVRQPAAKGEFGAGRHPPPAVYMDSVLECSVCRRLFDGRFKVFVPPHPEPFDTVECARRAAGAWGADKAAAVPLILPTIETVRPR